MPKRDDTGPRKDCPYKDGRGSRGRSNGPKRDSSGGGIRRNRNR